MSNRAKCVLGIDLGKGTTRSAAVDRRGHIFHQEEVPTPEGSGAVEEMFKDVISRRLKYLRDENLEIAGIGVSAPGFVRPEEGMFVAGCDVQLRNAPLGKIANDVSGLPVAMENDGNAAAIGEWFAGAARDVDDFVCLYMVKGGIGGGIFIEGKPYSGFMGTGAELGHIALDLSGPVCPAGCRGCLESLASGAALKAEARRLFAREQKASMLHEMCAGDPQEITVEMVATAADNGDNIAMDAFRSIGLYLGVGIVFLIHTFDPQMVVIGGSMATYAHLFLHVTKQTVYERGIPALVESTEIVTGKLGSDAAMVGAGALAWDCAGELRLL